MNTHHFPVEFTALWFGFRDAHPIGGSIVDLLAQAAERHDAGVGRLGAPK